MKTNETDKNSASRVARLANSTTLYPVLHLFLVAALLSPALTVLGGAVDVGGKRHVDTMTINLYVGGGTGMPDIVAVEEASLIRTESPGDLLVGSTNPATHVVLDYLQILLDALAARGARYAVVSTANEIDVELPLFNLQTGAVDDVRLTDRDAILVRTDLPPGQLRVSNAQHGNFRNVIQISSIGLSVLRGWCSVDVFVRGERFRYICTHLEEATVPQIQLRQALELLSGPAQVKLPVILAGDFNADTLHRNGTQTYDALIAAGFTDAWAALHPADLAGGLTWGHDEFLADPDTAPAWRIDLVLFRGTRFGATQAESIDIALDRTQPPLWASDHASVAAQVQFQPGPKRLR